MLVSGNISAQMYLYIILTHSNMAVLGSIVVSIPACHAGDRGSIPRRGELDCFFFFFPPPFFPENINPRDFLAQKRT